MHLRLRIVIPSCRSVDKLANLHVIVDFVGNLKLDFVIELCWEKNLNIHKT